MPADTIKTSIKNNVLTIEIPMQKAKPSASGKTFVVASTNGNIRTGVSVDGKEVVLGLNAYYKP